LNIGKQIRGRRKELGITADELAEKIGISRSTMFRYENGYIEKIPINIFASIAQVLRTTTAFLMNEEEKEREFADNIEATIMIIFSDNLVFLRKREGLSQQELANKVGLSRSAISMYESGARMPPADVLIILADFFNVKIDFLLGRDTRNTEQFVSGNEIIDSILLLSDQQQKEALKYVRYIANSAKNQT